MTTSIVVVGATGHVGAALCARVSASDSHRLAGAIASKTSAGASIPSDPAITINSEIKTPIDLVIDFSTDAGCRQAIEIARTHHAALVVGSTALSNETHALLTRAATRIAVLTASNMSLGANLLASLATRASNALGASYDISIVEAHRKNKRDAPSGTARHIARAIRQQGGHIDDDQILSIRSGDTVGEHTIRFAMGGEIIELTHRALNRDVFAVGAMRAADWLASQPAGHYQMTDVLGLS